MKADGHTARDIAKFLGVSRASVYRYMVDDAARPPLGASDLPELKGVRVRHRGSVTV